MNRFRSSSIESVSEYIHECWLTCLKDTDMIPAYKRKVSMNSGIHVKKLLNLNYFQNKHKIHTKDADQDNFDKNLIEISAAKLESDISIVNI